MRQGQQSPSASISDAQQQADRYNASIGDLQDYDCQKCKNKGYRAVVRNDVMEIEQCECLAVRHSVKLFHDSNISEGYKLDNFYTTAPWQKDLLEAAYRFLEDPQGWFFVGGQVGAGKTHICTGIVRELLRKGLSARYMMWRDDTVKIKAAVKDAEEYTRLVEPLKKVKVLYIADFFKSNYNQPTAADINLAFETLNSRYNRSDLITLISSEFVVDELIKMDEAIGSRIFEKSKYFQHNINRDASRNYRLRA